MAEQKPEVIFENLMKAYKFDYENASNPLVKTQAKQKANKLRGMASLFGIDQATLNKFGDNVLLKDTPGGETIDYGALAQTGKIWSSLTGDDPQSIAKRGIGQAIVTGLPTFGRTAASNSLQNAAYGQFLGQPSSVLQTGQQLVASATPTAGAAAVSAATPDANRVRIPNAVGGQQGSQTPIPTAGGTGAVITPLSAAGSATNALDNGGGAATAGTGAGATGAGAGAAGAGTGVVVDEDGTEEPVGSTGASSTDMEAYVKAGDFIGFVTSQSWCPTIVDPTTGKKTPDYANFKAGDWAAWSQLLTSFGNAAALVDEANGTYTKLEEQPGWKEYLNYMNVDLQTRLDNAKSAYDNTMAHYQNAQTAITEREKVALADIQNVLNLSMWKSRQSLAATGMVFSGLLAWGYQQGQFQAQQSAANVIINASEDFNNIAIDMATLGADYELEKKNTTNAQIAEIALERYKWLYGENDEYKKAQSALKTAMTALGIASQAAPGVVASTNQQATAEAATAAAEDAKWWLTTSIDALSKGINVIQNKDGTVTLTQTISPEKLAELRLDAAKAGFTIADDGTVSGTGITGKQIGDWMAEGIYYDPKTGKLTQQLTPAEQEDKRHNIEMERIARLTSGQQAARDAETVRHNKALEKIQSGKTSKSDDPWGTGYTQTQMENDLKIINSTSTSITQVQRGVAALSLAAGTGTGTATAKGFSDWLTGVPAGTLKGVDGNPVLDAAGKPISVPASLGFLALNETSQDALAQYLPDDLGFMARVAGDLKRAFDAGTKLTDAEVMNIVLSYGAVDAAGNPMTTNNPTAGTAAGTQDQREGVSALRTYFDADTQQRMLKFFFSLRDMLTMKTINVSSKILAGLNGAFGNSWVFGQVFQPGGGETTPVATAP